MPSKKKILHTDSNDFLEHLKKLFNNYEEKVNIDQDILNNQKTIIESLVKKYDP
jgi:hypothetical protein